MADGVKVTLMLIHILLVYLLVVTAQTQGTVYETGVGWVGVQTYVDNAGI